MEKKPEMPDQEKSDKGERLSEAPAQHPPSPHQPKGMEDMLCSLGEGTRYFVDALTDKERALLDKRFGGTLGSRKSDAGSDGAVQRIAKALWADASSNPSEEEIIKRIREIKKENRELHVDMRAIKDHAFIRAQESLEKVFEKYKRDCSSQSMVQMFKDAESEDPVRMWHLIAHACGNSEVVNWVIRWCHREIDRLPRGEHGEDSKLEATLRRLIEDIFDAVDGEGFRS